VLHILLVVDWAMGEQEKRGQHIKLNIVIGVYVSEMDSAS
jgi:hypothetical protein